LASIQESIRLFHQIIRNVNQGPENLGFLEREIILQKKSYFKRTGYVDQRYDGLSILSV